MIGRCVLVHQSEPAATLRRVAAAVRPGGIIAFMEPAVHVDVQMLPEFELGRALSDSLSRFLRGALPSPDIAGRIIPCYIDAGLPEPHVLWESVVPGSDPRHLRLATLTYETLLPLMQRFGRVDPRVGDPATLYDRVLSEARDCSRADRDDALRLRLGEARVSRSGPLMRPGAASERRRCACAMAAIDVGGRRNNGSGRAPSKT